jgi:tRNA G46 methylase TrmB
VARLYDRWHGIETDKRNLNVRYDPTEPKYIRWTFRNLLINPAEYSFVDFGSGKGWVLIAAAERPFLQVIGVEFSKDLHEAAVANISLSQANQVQKCNVSLHGRHAIFDPGNTLRSFFLPPVPGRDHGSRLRTSKPR